MKTRSRRFRQALSTVLLLTAWSSQTLAREAEAQATVSFRDLVQAGDVVTVTPWLGHRMTGPVTAVEACEMHVLVKAQTTVIPMSVVKTLRRHQPRRVNKGAATMMEIADRCHDIECLPAGLFYIGLGEAIQGLDNLGHPPKIVYRGRRPLDARSPCAAETVLTVAR